MAHGNPEFSHPNRQLLKTRRKPTDLNEAEDKPAFTSHALVQSLEKHFLTIHQGATTRRAASIKDDPLSSK